MTSDPGYAAPSAEPASARDPRPLAGRFALVTGASRGIGRASALALAHAGARVGLVSRTRSSLEALAEEIRDGVAGEVASEASGEASGEPPADDGPGSPLVLPADVSDADAVEALLQEVRAATGDVPDLVVASAGVFTIGAIHETDPETLALNLDVNLKGSFLLVRAVLPGMLERGSGDLIQVGSISGRKAFPGNGAYSASKFGLRGFHEVLLEELRGTGVRATLVEPAATDTPIWDPMDPDGNPDLPSRATMLRPEDVADAILWAATRRSGVHIPVLPVEPA